MTEPAALAPRRRDRLYAAVTRALAVLLLPVALTRRAGRAGRAGRAVRARELACGWALHLRFPAEDLAGLSDGARAAFTAARTEALWRHGLLLGLTSGYRHPLVQQRMFDEEVRRCGSPAAARRRVLPAAESRHVRGTALDVRPADGARWLEEHGARFGLYRTYENEWWHFEFHPDGSRPPPRRPSPAAPARTAPARTAPAQAMTTASSRNGDIPRTARRHPGWSIGTAGRDDRPRRNPRMPQ